MRRAVRRVAGAVGATTLALVGSAEGADAATPHDLSRRDRYTTSDGQTTLECEVAGRSTLHANGQAELVASIVGGDPDCDRSLAAIFVTYTSTSGQRVSFTAAGRDGWAGARMSDVASHLVMRYEIAHDDDVCVCFSPSYTLPK